MNRFIVAAFIGLTCVVVPSAQTAPPTTPTAPKAAPVTQTSAPVTKSATAAPVASHDANELTADAEHDLFARYCVGCHNEKAKASGVDSSRKLTIDAIDFHDVRKSAEKAELIVRKMRAGMMPPANVRRPEPKVYNAMIAWLEGELDRTAVAYTPPPGLHRVNRTEYANAIHDLLDLDVDPAKYLPSDDSTHGFDNIAGALGISSTLVEAYVTAAGKISRLAIGEATPPTLVVYRTPEDTSQDYHIEGLPFGTRGGMLIQHEFPADGDYNITMTPIFGDNMSPTGFGSVPCEKLEVLLDGERLALLDWQGGGRFGVTPANCGGKPAAPAAPQTFGQRQQIPKMTVKVKVAAGLHNLGVTFPQTNFAPVLDLDQHFQRDTLQTGPTPGFTFFPHVGTVRIEGPFNATTAKDSASRRKIFICTPTSAADESVCARKIVTKLATHAFRRPAATGDVDALMAFFKEGRKEGSFDQGIEHSLARILASPKFIYRIESEPVAAKIGQPYRISDLDLASRLSFFLWSTCPDDELMKIAAQEPTARSGHARAAGAADAQGPARRGARDQLRGAVAEPARSAAVRVRCR